MASNKNITMKQYNGTDYDTLYPATIASQIVSGTLSADRIPNLAASKITAGTFSATGVVAATGTDYTTARIRNIYANTTDMTAGSTSLTNGYIYVVYE